MRQEVSAFLLPARGRKPRPHGDPGPNGRQPCRARRKRFFRRGAVGSFRTRCGILLHRGCAALAGLRLPAAAGPPTGAHHRPAADRARGQCSLPPGRSAPLRMRWPERLSSVAAGGGATQHRRTGASDHPALSTPGGAAGAPGRRHGPHGQRHAARGRGADVHGPLQPDPVAGRPCPHRPGAARCAQPGHLRGGLGLRPLLRA